MRKFLFLAVLVAAAIVLGRRMRASGPAPARPAPAVPPPPPRPEPEDAAAPPRRTTNGERVVLLSISMLQERGDDATHEAVVRHLAAGELEPDEGTVDVLLHRLTELGCLVRGGDEGPYRLTSSGQGALLDGSSARPSPAGDAADELSSPPAREPLDLNTHS